MDAFTGEIRAFGFGYTPLDWLPCDGSLVPISEYDQLFSLLATRYGGDGQTNFGIPDLRGRVLLGANPNLLPFEPGFSGGSETVSLTVNTMPAHNHNLQVVARKAAAQISGAAAYPGPTVYLTNAYCKGSLKGIVAYSANLAPGNIQMGQETIAMTGAGAPHENRAPYLTVNYCICCWGEFPGK